MTEYYFTRILQMGVIFLILRQTEMMVHVK